MNLEFRVKKTKGFFQWCAIIGAFSTLYIVGFTSLMIFCMGFIGFVSSIGQLDKEAFTFLASITLAGIVFFTFTLWSGRTIPRRIVIVDDKMTLHYFWPFFRSTYSLKDLRFDIEFYDYNNTTRKVLKIWKKKNPIPLQISINGWSGNWDPLFNWVRKNRR